MKPSDKLVDFIKAYETLHDGDLQRIDLQPKLDGAGIWTEGWGHAMRLRGKLMRVEEYPTLEDVLPYSLICTDEEAEHYLQKDLEEASVQVNTCLTIPVEQNQFDALVSHCYNCGMSITLYRLINSGAPESDIKEWWTTTYITSSGTYMKGLQYRRNDEWEMWKHGDYTRDYKISI